LCYYWCFSRAYLFILLKLSLLLEYFLILITIRYTKVSGLKTGNIWQFTNRSVVTKNFYYTSIQTCMTQILRTSVIKRIIYSMRYFRNQDIGSTIKDFRDSFNA
jgi:hypothetical protein